MKAIETNYNGYRFRSRLEARWAVFFDTLGLRYEYEKEGFKFGQDAGSCYLPDFWLPQVHMWAEVKPEEFSRKEESLCEALYLYTGYPVLRLIGLPDYRSYEFEMFIEMNQEIQLFRNDCYVNSDYLDEDRFFTGTGDEPAGRLNREYLQNCPHYTAAVNAARGARFEFNQ